MSAYRTNAKPDPETEEKVYKLRPLAFYALCLWAFNGVVPSFANLYRFFIADNPAEVRAAELSTSEMDLALCQRAVPPPASYISLDCEWEESSRVCLCYYNDPVEGHGRWIYLREDR